MTCDGTWKRYWDIGIYGTKNKVSKERFVAGGIHGGLHVNYHLHNHLDLFLEPRVNHFYRWHQRTGVAEEI